MEYHFFRRMSFYFMMIFFLFGVLYFFFPADSILSITYNIMCVIIVLIGIVKLVFLSYDKEYPREFYFDLVEGVIDLIVGVVCYNFGSDYYLVSLICGILYAIIPVSRVVLAPKLLNQMFLDSPKFIFIILLVLNHHHLTFWLSMFLGCLFTLLGIVILSFKIYHLVLFRKGEYNHE